MLQGKKILFITPRFFYPPNDGAKIVFFGTFKFFSENNEVDVISNVSKSDKKYIPYIQNKVNRINYANFDVKKQHIFLLLRSLIFGISYLYLKYFRQDILKKLEEYLTTKSYDIVWIESSYMSFYIPFIKEKFPHLKVFLRSHNVEYLLLQRVYDETKNPIKRFLLKREVGFMKKEEIRLMGIADKIFTISLVDQNQFIQENPELGKKIVMLFPVVDFQKYQKTPITTNKNIVFIGSMDYLPNAHGIEWFVNKVFPEVQKAHPDAILYIVGSGMPKSFEHMKKNKNIVLDKGIKEDTFYYEKAQIFICPLFSGSGIKIKIINAFACGKPILSTSIGIEGLSVDHSKNILVGETEKEWIQLLVDSLGRIDLLNSIGDAGFSYAQENFNAAKVFKNLEL